MSSLRVVPGIRLPSQSILSVTWRPTVCEQAVLDAVAAQLEADAVLHLAAEQIAEPGLPGAAAAHPALVELLELVALRAVELIGEVRVQIEVLIEAVEHARGSRSPRRCGATRRRACTSASCRRRCRRANRSARSRAVERALRDLVGGVPLAGVGRCRDAPAEGVVAQAVAQHAVDLLEVIGLLPGAVVVQQLERVEQVPLADRLRRPRPASR